MARVRKYSIYLIKEDRTEIGEILSRNNFTYREVIQIGDTELGEVFAAVTDADTPDWAEVFEPYIDPLSFGEVSGSGAVLLVRTAERIFALTFGTGRYFLRNDCFEEKFGLLVVLNSVSSDKIKALDKLRLGAISKHSREQTSKEAKLQDFGLDIEQDLLRGVTGIPRDRRLGRLMAGRDALSVTVKVPLDELRELLERYLAKFQDDTYKEAFPWVDHLSEVKDVELKIRLDEAMVAKIRAGEWNDMWMASPEVLDWNQIDGFRYGGRRNHPVHYDMDLAEFVDELEVERESVDRDVILHSNVLCVADDDRVLQRWNAYKCICCETDLENESFLLNSGNWYRVGRNFVTEVNEAYNRIPRYVRQWIEYNHATEALWNRAVAAADRDYFALMDTNLIRHGEGNNSVEFCDLYTRDRSLIHVKRYGQSSVLSHLFAQGLVSGELFRTDIEFRRKVNEELPEGHRLADHTVVPVNQEYQIVFGIISDKDGDELRLPFFSRVNIRHVARRLEGYGYRVALSKIPVAAEKKQRRRFL